AAAGAPAQAAPRKLPPAADAGGAAAGPVASGGGRGRARPPGARATQGPGHLVPGGRGARPVRQHHRRPPGPRRVLRPGGRLRAGPEQAGLRQTAHHRQLPADRAYRGPPAGTAQRAALAGGDAELARTAPGAASVHSANGGRKSADRPTATANKKPATKRRGLFVGWSTRMRWPPSSASEHPVIGGRENADRPADYSGLPRLPCWLTNCWTAFRSLGSTVRRSSRSNRSARCAGRLGAWPTPALMTASGNLTGWAVPRVTMGVARLRRHSRAARTPMAVCGSSSSPHSL